MDNTPETTLEELTLREQAVALRERRLKARELLSEHHLPPQVGEALNYDSDEALEQSIALAKAVMAATRNTQAPRAPAPAPDTRSMTYAQRAALYLAHQPMK